MDSGNMVQQMIGMHKTFFTNTFNGMVVLQDYSENFMDGFLRQFPWVTEENKKPLMDSISSMKKAREEYKVTVERGFTMLEEMTGKY